LDFEVLKTFSKNLEKKSKTYVFTSQFYSPTFNMRRSCCILMNELGVLAIAYFCNFSTLSILLFIACKGLQQYKAKNAGLNAFSFT